MKDFYKMYGGEDLPKAQRGFFKEVIKQGAKKLDDLKGLAEDLPLFVDNEPPKVIVFRDAKELEEYNNMTEEEQNALDDKKKPTIKNFFNSGGEA